MKTFIRCCMRALLMLTIAGCSAGPDSDSISSQNPVAATTTPDCLACHFSGNPALDPIMTNGSGTAGKHVAHVDGNVPVACVKCHFNYTDQPTHMNGTLDSSIRLVYFDSTNPDGDWSKTVGPPEAGTCSSLVCHGPDTLDWYGTIQPIFHGCAMCHTYPTGTRRQILGPGGDFGSNTQSHHVAGTIDPGDEQCMVCHDQTAHFSGTVRLRHADSGTTVIPYTTAQNLEQFCLSCHDDNGATVAHLATGTALDPFGEDNSGDRIVLGQAPYPFSRRIATSWGKSYGHGPNGQHDAIKKLTCLGTGQPGTGCHGNNGQINAHGSTNQVLAAKQYKYDINFMNFGYYDYNDQHFDLCFSCHSIYLGVTKEDTLGVKFGGILDDPTNLQNVNGYQTNAFGPRGFKPPYQASIGIVTTHFADHNDSNPLNLNNDLNIWGVPNKNLHWYHLGWMAASFRGPGDCFLSPANCSGISCVNCHDVHGSETPFGAVYDEMVYANYPSPDGISLLGKMTEDAYNSPLLKDYPTYCAFNCHPILESTKAWYSPMPE